MSFITPIFSGRAACARTRGAAPAPVAATPSSISLRFIWSSSLACSIRGRRLMPPPVSGRSSSPASRRSMATSASRPSRPTSRSISFSCSAWTRARAGDERVPGRRSAPAHASGGRRRWRRRSARPRRSSSSIMATKFGRRMPSAPAISDCLRPGLAPIATSVEYCAGERSSAAKRRLKSSNTASCARRSG